MLKYIEASHCCALVLYYGVYIAHCLCLPSSEVLYVTELHSKKTDNSIMYKQDNGHKGN